MSAIQVGKLLFNFPATWAAEKVDDWSFYVNQFQRVCTGTKSVDIVAVGNHCCWLIEVKDYRVHPRTKAIDLPDEIAQKVRDSLGMLLAASFNATNNEHKTIACDAVCCDRLRVVLHLEQPAKHSKLFPRAINPANVQNRLKQLLKAIDPHPIVLDKSQLEKVQWTVHDVE